MKNILAIIFTAVALIAGITHTVSDEVVFMTIYTAIILAFLPEEK